MTALSDLDPAAPARDGLIYHLPGGNSRGATGAELLAMAADAPDPADYATIVKASGQNDPTFVRNTRRATYLNYNNDPNTGSGNKLVMRLKSVTAASSGSVIWQQRTFARAEHGAAAAGVFFRASGNSHGTLFGQLKDSTTTWALRQIGYTDEVSYAGATWDKGMAGITERPPEWYKVTWTGSTTFRLYASLDGDTFFPITQAQDLSGNMASFNQFGFALNVVRGSGITDADNDAHWAAEYGYVATTGLT